MRSNMGESIRERTPSSSQFVENGLPTGSESPSRSRIPQVNAGALKRFSLTIIGVALLLAVFNLYMNMMMNYNLPALQLDMSADGDLFGFHESGHDHGPPPKGKHHPDRHSMVPDQALRKLRPHGHQVDACMGVCPAHENNPDQAGYVADVIARRIQATEMKEPELESLHTPPAEPKVARFTAANISNLWNLINSWPDSRSLWPQAYHNWTMVIQAVKNARILRASVPKKGVQVKAFVELEGGMHAYLKPKRFDRNSAIHGRPYQGPDRHNAEIAGFHLARLLGLRRVPVTVGRFVDARNELFKVADATLIDSFFSEPDTERLCFYRRGRCAYCHKGYAACTESGTSTMEASLSLEVPGSKFTLREFRHPWARTYKDDTQAPWEKEVDYCSKIATHEIYGQSPIFLDLMETAIFDFLIGNADRHRIELTMPTGTDGNSGQYGQSMVLLLDNGKGFRSPDHDEMSILAPLYQCCRVRRRMYDILHYFAGAEMNLGAALDSFMLHDPVYPVLPVSYLKAVNRRLLKVLSLVEICVERHGRKAIQDDGYR